MIALINNEYKIDLSKPFDISIPLTNNEQNPIAWYQNLPEIEPVIFSSIRMRMARIQNV